MITHNFGKLNAIDRESSKGHVFPVAQEKAAVDFQSTAKTPAWGKLV